MREGCAVRRTLVKIAFPALLAAVLIPLTAQQPSDSLTNILQNNETMPVAMPDGLLHLDVTVTNSDGHSVLGLKAGDFTLLDNGKATPIVTLAAYQGAIRPDPPVTVTLVLDKLLAAEDTDLGSIEDQQAEKFLRQRNGYLAQPTNVLELTHNGLWLVGDPSMNGLALADAIARHDLTMRVSVPDPRDAQFGPDGAAASPDLAGPPPVAALKALGVIATTERRLPGRKLLFWIGPGWNIGSGRNAIPDLGPKNREASFDESVWFSTLLRLARINLYTFSLGEGAQPGVEATINLAAALSAAKAPASPEDVTPFDLNRKLLAVESGGRVFPPGADIVTEIDNCLRERNAFYTLSFNPSAAGRTDEYHTLKLVIHDVRLNPRTISGYYDEPYFTDDPDPALRNVTVAELDRLLDDARDKSDGDLAKLLDGLRLTERYSPEKQAARLAQLRGKKSREALESLADNSAFLNPPPSEIAADPQPTAQAQQQILKAAGDYLNQIIPRLPDFFATRSSADYAQLPSFKPSDRSFTSEPFHETGRTRATVLYRNGGEIVDAKSQHAKQSAYTLTTYGTFGPMLTVVKAALSAPDRLAWLRWEKAATGPAAVFHYSVPQAQSLYHTIGCCLPQGDGSASYTIVPGYSGEIAIDPSTGAILRVIVQASLDNFVPANRSAVSVTYGPVQIGGRTYVLPQQSVSIFRQRTVQTFVGYGGSFRDWGPYAATLNAFGFTDYHNFHADMRILTGFAPADGETPQPDSATPPQH